jgi:fibronectin type 3 domain-containing protein
MLFVLSACADNSSAPPVPAPVPMVCCSGTLTWEPNTETDLAGYHVYRFTTQAIPTPLPTPIATVTTPVFIDITGIEGTTYYYVVTAFDNATPENESGVSNEVSKQY